MPSNTHLENNIVNTTRNAGALLFIVAVVWGSSYVVVKDILNDIQPSIYLTIRYALSVVVVMLLYNKNLSLWLANNNNNRKQEIKRLIHPGLWLATAFMLQSYGLTGTGPGKAALLTALVFVLIPIVEIFNKKQEGVLRFLPTLALATLGVFVLAKPWVYGWQLNDILLVACAAAFSIQIFLTGIVSKDVHFSIIFIIQGSVVFVISAVVWCIFDHIVISNISFINWMKLLYVTIVVTVVCYLLVFYAQRFVKARYVGLIYSVEPLAAVLISVLLGYEKITTSYVLGSLIILISVVLAIYISGEDAN